MATHLALDPKLLDQVLELSGELTKKAAVTLALKEFVARREQRKLADLFGQLDGDPAYDHKTSPPTGRTTSPLPRCATPAAEPACRWARSMRC